MFALHIPNKLDEELLGMRPDVQSIPCAHVLLDQRPLLAVSQDCLQEQLVFSLGPTTNVKLTVGLRFVRKFLLRWTIGDTDLLCFRGSNHELVLLFNHGLVLRLDNVNSVRIDFAEVIAQLVNDEGEPFVRVEVVVNLT